MRIIWFVVAATVYSLSSAAQDFNHYNTLLPKGSIPKDFTEMSSSKVVSEVTSLEKNDNARVKRSKKTFVMESTFSVDDFLASGNVLFNDDVSVYLQRVLDEVLKLNPELQGKTRIYAVKSSSVNAFTAGNGIIFVNLGLLARLDNEAQLAFILAHEIVHYQKHHAINAYVTNVEIERARGDYRNLSVSEKGFAKSTFSKEQEFEADLNGSEIYLKTVYSKDSIQKVFDILKYADLPLIRDKLNTKSFESEHYIFPDSLTQYEKDSTFIVDENYDDSQSTHPNIKKRKEAVTNKFVAQAGGALFKVSEQSFLTTRKIAQFELCRSLLLERRFVEAFALAINLQLETSSSVYLKETIAKALYGMAMYKLHNDWLVKSESLPDAATSFVAFFNNQSAYETSVMAIRHLYTCKETNPANEEIGMMLNDLIQNFGKENTNADENFLRKSDQSKLPELPYAYTQYAFLDFKDTGAFFKLFDKQMTQAKKPVTPKKKKSSRHPDKSVKASKVVVVNPMYRIVDVRRRKHKKVQHIESEQVLINVNTKINDAASKLKMKVDIINPNKLTSTQVSTMQSNTILNDWIDEKMKFSDRPLVSPIYNEVIAVAEKHKTDHFMWLGGGTVKTKINGKVFGVLGAIIMPSIAPFIAVNWAIPKGHTLYYALGFNVRTQQLELVDLRQQPVRDNRWLLQSNIYNTLYMLKH